MKRLFSLLLVVMLMLVVTACGAVATPSNPDVATPDTGQNSDTDTVDPTTAEAVATAISTSSPEPMEEATVVTMETPDNITPEAEGTPAPNETVVTTQPATVPATATESANVPSGALMVYTRDGGIAGFCDTVTVYRDTVEWVTCNQSQPGGSVPLAPALRDQLLTYVTTYGPSTISYTDAPGAADAMTTGIQFFGTGSQELTAADEQALLALGNEIMDSVYGSTQQ